MRACLVMSSWRRGAGASLAVLLAAAIGYFLFPDSLGLLTRIIAMMLLVLALDLVTGYCGVATLGHSALFGAGAYSAGLLSAHYGIHDPLLMIGVGLLAGATAGIVCGAIILRAQGLPQLVLSIALVQLFHELANKLYAWTGGSDGLSGVTPGPLLGIFEFDLFGHTAYVLGVILLITILVMLDVIVRSPFGMLCRAVKEDPLRVEAMGASPKSVLLRIYIISGAVAGAGGALEAISSQVVALGSLSFTQSAEALVMLVLGGSGSIFGAVMGTSAFMLVEDAVSASNPFHWLTIIGAMLIGVVLFAPKGLYGTIADFFARRGRARL